MRQDGYVRWIEKDPIHGSVFYSWSFFQYQSFPICNTRWRIYPSWQKMGAGFSIILTANTRNIVWRIYPSYRVKRLTRVSNLGYIWANRLCSKRFYNHSLSYQLLKHDILQFCTGLITNSGHNIEVVRFYMMEVQCRYKQGSILFFVNQDLHVLINSVSLVFFQFVKHNCDPHT